MYKHLFKRLLDIIFACVFLIPSVPIIVLIAFLSIIIHRSWKVFFVQSRIGYKNKGFNMLKIKTMSNAKDSKGNLLPDQRRVTPFGIFLRRTSLDELPQLINILLGDMSIVGPRPFTAEDCYNNCTSKQLEIRHQVRPGLTGLAQVYGRNSIDFNTKVRYDIFYVNHISLKLDIAIFFRTANVVVE